MGILSSLLRAGPAPHDDFWFTNLGATTASGQQVTPESAMRVAAVYASVRVLSETLASLPLITYERLSNGGKERASNHPLFDVLHTRANKRQTSFEWREMMQAHVVLRGNAYSEIVPGPRGAVDQLVPIHPDRVKPQVLDNGDIEYEVAGTNGSTTLPSFRMFHLRGLSSDGVIGLSPIEQARESIGAALAADDYAARYFKNDATPGGILNHPGHFKDREAFNNFRKQWNESQSGRSRHSTAILEDGMEFKPISITNVDSQFLESRKYSVTDIARIFRIPAHLIGDLEKATFSNIEQQSLEFVIHTMRPWFVRWEQAITRDLIIAKDRFFAEFLVDGLLRGDQKSRYESHASAIQSGWVTRNEVRKTENMNPLPGLDEPLQQMNMTATQDQAARVVRKEIIAVSEAHDKRDPEDFQAWATEYYSKYRKFVRENIDAISMETAQAYTEASHNEIKTCKDISKLMLEWQSGRSQQLVQLIENQ